MTYGVKFAFVAGCFAVALLSYFKCRSKKDWAFLVSGLAFTVLADYFLIMQNAHLHGVAVFCFAHICYIIRACSHYASGTSFWPDFRHSSLVAPSALSKCASSQPPRLAKIRRKNLPASVVGTGPRANLKLISDHRFLAAALSFAAAFTAALAFGSVLALAVIYACLFAVNIGVNVKCKTRLPKRNRALVLAGLVLFALCDINVMLINLPGFFGAPGWLTSFRPLIWVFYLPSQALLAISAYDYNAREGKRSA